MLPSLSIGPFFLQTPGLALLIGVWVGLSLAEKEALSLKFKKDQVYNLVFVGLLAGIVGARIVYAIRFLDIYLDDPLSLFALNPGTLSPSGGIFLGLLAAILYGIWKKLPLRKTLDAFAPGLAVFMIFWGLTHLLSGDAFGSATDLPWAINLWDENRHPTQIYEILLAVGVFIVIRKRPLGRPGDGINFLLYVALISAARLFLEAFRGDSLIWVGGFRAAQLISLSTLMVCLWLIRKWDLPTVRKANK
jgi:phosphatidylglycerol:prolipoprotein diacylglycerol transferase